jgi:hypothetical protein
MHGSPGFITHEATDIMHRTEHLSHRNDLPRRLHRARWALTVLAAAAVAACGGSSSDEPTTPANQAPGASIDLPAANTNFFSTDTVHITATASDTDGTIAKVEFLADGAKIGEDTTAPYAFDWVNPPVGPHTLTVRAIDNAGASTLSASRTISSAQNQVPTVSMAAPANNFKANAGTAVLLSANAADTDGTIAKVEYFKINPSAPVFDATTLVGQGTAVGTPPAYQLTTAALTAGVYNFVARATDNKGDTSTSASVQVIINALPAVSITAPTAGASIIPGTSYTLRATASDADGSISKVEFFLNGSTTALGQATRVGTTSEYTLNWTAVTGAVSFTARATDNDGAQTTTASVAANVPPNVLPSVTLDNPAAGTNAPTNLTLSASASDGDGSVTGVEFAYTFNSVTTKVAGTLAAGKWTATVPVSAAQFGTYAVTATATDNLGGKTTSASKNITIAANVPPTVNITSQAAVTLDAGNANKDITLTATASDTDGIAKVEFFDGATKIGEDTTAPYSIVLPGKAAGTYTITAKATDTVGSTTTSVAQTLVVTPNLEGPWATLNDAQKAGLNKNGLTLVPNVAIGDGGTVAGAVMQAIGVSVVAPKFVTAMSQAMRDVADLPIDIASSSVVNCPGGGTVQTFPIGTDQYAVKLTNCKTTSGFNLFGGESLELIHAYTNTAPDNVCPPGQEVLPATVPPQCRFGTEVKYVKLANDHFRILVNTAQVSGNGAPEPASEPYPHNAYGFAFVECWGTGANKSCVTSFENAFFWGNDLAWTNWSANGTVYPTVQWNVYATDDSYTFNGTVRPCQADPQPENRTPEYCQTTPPAAFHIKFDGMKVNSGGTYNNNSGRAIVYGNNGWSVATRLPATPGNPSATPDPVLQVERLSVQSTINGVQQAADIYKCPVNAAGLFACTKE